MKPEHRRDKLKNIKEGLTATKDLFRSIFVELNNDVKNETKLFDLAQKGESNCAYMLDVLNMIHLGKVEIVVGKDGSVLIKFCPKSVELIINDSPSNLCEVEMKLIN